MKRKPLILSLVLFAVILGIAPEAYAKAVSLKNPITFSKSRITLITPTLFRLEYAEDGVFIDDPTLFAYDRSALLDDYSVKDLGDGHYEIKTSDITIKYWDNGYPFGQNFEAYHLKDGRKTKFNIRGTYNMNLGASVETLDKQSGEIPMGNGVLARSGWYILDDEYSDVLKDGWIAPRNAPKHLQDKYVFLYGADFKAALRDLGAISGNVPMTRKYIHGVWFCRYWDYGEKDFYEIADQYNANGFPLDNIVSDMAWHENDGVTGVGSASRYYWTGYDWNRKLFPDPKRFVDNMHARGLSVSLNDHPHDGVRPSEDCYADFMKEIGAPQDSVVLFNLADRKYMDAFWKYTHKPKTDIGLDFWWLDWQQNYAYPKVRGHQSTSLSWINELYWRYSRVNGLRGCSFSRWAGWGDHRHPVQFSGDAHITWPMLAFEIKLSAHGCGDGCYYWLHDIGGFKGNPDSEMNVRWTQFGALSAALRIHSTNSAKLDRRPWLGTPQEVAALREIYHFRSRLMPYVYSSVRQVHETMIPLNRPMFVEYPLEEAAYENEQEYLFGDLLLCAPITSPGEGASKTASQKVWFPAGDVWYDWFTSEKVSGGVTRDIAKPLSEFPLYVKGGWLLPMQPYTSRPATEPLTALELYVWPSEGDCDNTYTLYEDDGVTEKYISGEYAKTALRYVQKGGKATVTVTHDGGRYAGQPEKRSVKVIYHKLDGTCAEVSSKLQPSRKTVTFELTL